MGVLGIAMVLVVVLGLGSVVLVLAASRPEPVGRRRAWSVSPAVDVRHLRAREEVLDALVARGLVGELCDERRQEILAVPFGTWDHLEDGSRPAGR